MLQLQLLLLALWLVSYRMLQPLRLRVSLWLVVVSLLLLLLWMRLAVRLGLIPVMAVLPLPPLVSVPSRVSRVRPFAQSPCLPPYWFLVPLLCLGLALGLGLGLGLRLGLGLGQQEVQGPGQSLAEPLWTSYPWP